MHGTGAGGRAALLRAAHATLDDSTGGLVAVIGEPGIGKTTFLRSLAERAGPGALVGSAVAPLAWVPHLVLQHALGVDLRGTAPQVAHEVVARARGCVLVLDDLQWCDRDTIEVLHHVVADLSVVVAFRPEAFHGSALRRLAEVTGRVIDLPPLTDDEARALVRRHRPGAPEAVVDSVIRTGAGNPLLLQLDPVDGDVGNDAVERVTAEVARCGTEARRLIARLALGRRSAPVDLSDGSSYAVAEAVRNGLVEVDGSGSAVLRHDLFGVAALRLIGDDEQRVLHRELAAEATRDGERARHLLACGEPGDAARLAQLAADAATTAQERAEHLDVAVQALGDGAPDDLLVADAEAMVAASRSADALELATRVRDRQGPMRARWAAATASAAWLEGRHAECEAAIDAVRDAAADLDAAAALRLAVTEARVQARVRWDGPGAVETGRRALAIAESAGLPTAEALAAISTASLVAGTDEWRTTLRAAISEAADEGDEWTRWTAQDTLFMAELVAGDPTLCTDIAGQAVDEARQVADRTVELQMRKNLVLARYHVDGDLAPVVTEAAELLDRVVHERTREHLEATLAMAHGDLGQLDEAEEVIGRAIGWEVEDPTARAMILWSRAETDWQAGRPQAAMEAGARCRELPLGGFPAHDAVEPIRQWSALDLGIDPGEPMTGTLFPNMVGASLESAAIVALHREPEDPRTVERFLAAADAWRRISAKGALRCRWAAGEAARLAGERRRAAAILEPVADDLRAAGRVPLLRRCLRSLRDLGVRQRRPVPEPVGTLTGPEVEVLDLVARGLDTTGIARRLAVSAETVESAVRSARRRLDAPTRLAAARALTELRGGWVRPHRTAPDLGGGAERAPDTPPDSPGAVDPAEVGDGVVVELDPAGAPADPRRDVPLGDLPDSPWDLGQRGVVATAVVRGPDAVDASLLAAVRGAGLSLRIHRDLGRIHRATLVDHLRRLGPVRVAARPGTEHDPVDDLVVGAARHLAEGASVGDAAAALGVSVRSLYRALATARARAGVTTNAELVASITV